MIPTAGRRKRHTNCPMKHLAAATPMSHPKKPRRVSRIRSCALLCVSLAVWLALCGASANCETGYTKVWLSTYGKHYCFRLTDSEQTWDRARSSCQFGFGAELAVWGSEAGECLAQGL